MSSEIFTQLVDAHYTALYRFALSLTKSPSDAGDLTQQTFFIWAKQGHALREAEKVVRIVFPLDGLKSGRCGPFMFDLGHKVGVAVHVRSQPPPRIRPLMLSVGQRPEATETYSRTVALAMSWTSAP